MKIKEIISNLLLTVLILAFFQMPEYFSKLYAAKVEFIKTNKAPLKFEADISNLEEGRYYVSYGLVRAACEAKVDGIIKDSNISSGNGVKSALLMGHSLDKKDQKKLTLECQHQDGFITSTANTPIIASEKIGKFVQLYRGFTSIALGLGSSVFLLIVTFISFLILRKNQSFKSQKFFLTLAICGVFYMLSYAQIPRLWIEGDTATYFHICIRNLFTVASLLVLSQYLGLYKKVPYFFALAVPVYLFWSFKDRSFEALYKPNCALLAAFQCFYTYKLIIKKDYSKQVSVLRAISVVWSLALCLDVYSLYTAYAQYNTPIIMTLTSLTFIYLIIYDHSRLEILDFAVKNILDLSKKDIKPKQLLKEFSSVLLEQTKFMRVSSYVDGFVIGEETLPKQSLYRVFDKGYSKDTSRDTKIDFLDQTKGLKLKEAFETKQIVKGKGKDGGFYLIIPVGEFSLIALSDDQEVSEYQYQMSIETIDRLKHGFSSIEKRIQEFGTRESQLLTRLKDHFQSDKVLTKAYAFTLDIHDFSKNCERYVTKEHKNVYANFVSSEYLPGLIRAVSEYAYPEALEGDLISFIVVEDLLHKNPSDAVESILKTLIDYKENTGNKSCVNQGFEVITFSVALSYGDLEIVFDESKARSSGSSLKNTKRILEILPRNSIAIDYRYISKFKFNTFSVSEPKQILVKKDYFEVATLGRLNSMRKFA